MKASWLLLSIWLVANANTAYASTRLYEDMSVLTSPAHQGREAGSLNPNITAKFLYDRFQGLGIKVNYQSFEFKSGFFSKELGHNVIATLHCTVEQCGKKLIITAHYDHLGGRKSSFYAGANDNASGTAALLAIAEALKEQTRFSDVIFLATDAEEKGLYGAKHYVSETNTNDYALNINLDMLAINNRNTLYALHDKKAKRFIEQFKRQETSFKVFSTSSQFRLHKKLNDNRINWHKASDHYAFSLKKIPYIYFGMGIDDKHHTKKDTLDNINFEKYQQVVDSISDFIVSLAQVPLDSTN